MINRRIIAYLRPIVSLLVVTMLISCNYSGDTLGYSSAFVFPFSENVLKIKIDSLFNQHPQYKIPDKWHELDNWNRRGLGFLQGKIFYFREQPEEMFYVTSGVSDNINVHASLFIRAINRGYRWFKFDELDEAEKKRVEYRFEKSICSKLGNYSKSN
jgi:hypothetical protein